jgi:hypothetical protein
MYNEDWALKKEGMNGFLNCINKLILDNDEIGDKTNSEKSFIKTEDIKERQRQKGRKLDIKGDWRKKERNWVGSKIIFFSEYLSF